MKKIFFALLFCAVAVCTAEAQGTATIRARFEGTTRDMIYFDFMEQSGANMEFPYREGREIEFDVELDGITLMKINTFVLVVVQPGDVIEIDVEYEGRNYRNARFGGTSAASVAASEVLNSIRAARLERGYKTNIPAAIVVQTPPEKYFAASVSEWREEVAMLDGARDRLTPEVYNFVRSELDAIFIPNIVTYPGHNLQDGFWTALDNYTPRDDDASLRNHSYMGMLGTYMRYMQVKAAREAGVEFAAPANIQDEYAAIAGFFDGKLRDAALLVFLFNVLATGEDFEAVEKLYEDYVERYNINPRYKEMLVKVME